MTRVAVRHGILDAVGFAPALALGLLPVLHLILLALGAPSSDSAQASWQLDGRTLGLLRRSLAIAASASAGALGLGLAIGIPLARLRFRGRRILAGALLAAFALSPYWMALGWIRADLASAPAQLLLGSPAAVAFVLATAYAPAVALLVLLAARAVPVAWEEAALLAAPLRLALLRILLPLLLPLLAVAAVLVFALCFADYEVASLLQVVTYPVEVFLFYAGVFAPGEAARACLPLLAVAIATATALAWGLGAGMTRQWPARVLGEWPLPRWQARGLLALALLWVAGFVAWPALGLLSQLEPTLSSWQGLRGGAPALANSLATTLAAVLLALAFGGMAAGALVRARPALRTALVAALLVPLCLPGPAFGIAWVELLSLLPSSSRALLAALPALAPALCIAARWAGLVAVLVAAARLALPQSALDAARLQEGSAVRRAWRIELPLIRPMLLAATAVIASLAHSATGTLVLTVPAGFEVAPLRIDNLLHYGARDQAVALAVVAAVLAAGIPLALALAANRFWRNAG